MKLTTLLLTTLLLSSCYTKQGAIRRFCQQDTVRAEILVTVHDTIKLPGDTVLFSIHDTMAMDSLTMVFQDSLNAVFAQKSHGQIKFKVISKPQTIYRTREVKVPVALPCDCPKPGPSKLQWIGFWICCVMLLFLGLWFGKRL